MDLLIHPDVSDELMHYGVLGMKLGVIELSDEQIRIGKKYSLMIS